jgi:hypothetical protein
MRQLNVGLIGRVYPVTAFSGFEVDVCVLGVFTYCFPKHLSLVVAQVDAMYMRACVFALYVKILGMDGQYAE